MDAVIFFGCAAIILAGGAGVVLARNPVHSALFLVMTMITIAVLFLQLQAPLVAIVQIVVYASAIVVLFLFVIMLLGVDKHETLDDPGHRFQRPAAAVLGLVALAGLLALSVGRWQLGAKPKGSRSISDHGDEIRPLARELFTRFAWPFEVTAVLLVIAVIGAVVLARRSSRPSLQDAERP